MSEFSQFKLVIAIEYDYKDNRAKKTHRSLQNNCKLKDNNLSFISFVEFFQIIIQKNYKNRSVEILKND